MLNERVNQMSSFITGVKKLIYIHKFPEPGGSKQPGKANSLADLGTDLLALVETDKPNSAPVSPKPVTPKPAPPSTQDAQKKQPIQDDTPSLTELEKQAEMEVNFLTKKKDKGMVWFANLLISTKFFVDVLYLLLIGVASVRLRVYSAKISYVNRRKLDSDQTYFHTKDFAAGLVLKSLVAVSVKNFSFGYLVSETFYKSDHSKTFAINLHAKFIATRRTILSKNVLAHSENIQKSPKILPN